MEWFGLSSQLWQMSSQKALSSQILEFNVVIENHKTFLGTALTWGKICWGSLKKDGVVKSGPWMLLQRRFVFFFLHGSRHRAKYAIRSSNIYRHYILTSLLLFFSIFSLSLYFPFPANKLNLDKDLQPETSCLPTKLTLTLHENSFWLFEEFVFIRERLQASRYLLDIHCSETENEL